LLSLLFPPFTVQFTRLFLSRYILACLCVNPSRVNMYQNNISERSSSRVLQRPGGHQSINLFGGSDEPVEQPKQRTGRRQQQEITASIGSQAHNQAIQQSQQQQQQARQSSNDSAPAPTNNNTYTAPYGQDTQQPPQSAAGNAAPRVNNIWGGDDQPQRSSTRVLRGPGGGSSGVAGALGGPAAGTQAEPEPRRTGGGYRSNQTSANSPFSSEPEPQRSSTRVNQAPGGGGNGNILSWGH